MAIHFSLKDGVLNLAVRAVPRASRTEIVGEHNGSLKIRVSSPPVDGAANDEIVKAAGESLWHIARNVSITAGQTSKLKRVSIVGADVSKIDDILKS